MTLVKAEKLIDLDLPGRRTPTSFELPEDLSEEEWRSLGVPLLRAGETLMWWIGDWLNYGERKWGETYTAASELTGLEYGTLAHARGVARHVEVCRRRQNLSFSHHAEVVALEPETQDDLLAQAEDEGWSVRRMREAVRAVRRGHRDGEERDATTAVATLRIDVDEEHRGLLDEAVALAESGLRRWFTEHGIDATIEARRIR